MQIFVRRLLPNIALFIRDPIVSASTLKIRVRQICYLFEKIAGSQPLSPVLVQICIFFMAQAFTLLLQIHGIGHS